MKLAEEVLDIHEAKGKQLTVVRKFFKAVDNVDKELRKKTKEMEKKWGKLSSQLGVHQVYDGVAWAKKHAKDNKVLIKDAGEFDKFKKDTTKKNIKVWKSGFKTVIDAAQEVMDSGDREAMKQFVIVMNKLNYDNHLRNGESDKAIDDTESYSLSKLVHTMNDIQSGRADRRDMAKLRNDAGKAIEKELKGKFINLKLWGVETNSFGDGWLSVKGSIEDQEIAKRMNVTALVSDIKPSDVLSDHTAFKDGDKAKASVVFLPDPNGGRWFIKTIKK